MASSAQMLRSGSGVATTFATVVRASRRNHSLLAAACSRQPQNRRVVATTSLFQGMGSVKGLLLGEGLPRLGCRHLSEHGSAPSATAKWMDSYQRHFSETEALNKWMVQVREQPENLEGDRVVGALMAFLLHGMFSGQNSLASAVFWAHLLQTATADDCTMLFSDLVQACESGLVPREEEQCDTFFRALFLKNDPDLDVFLRQYADDCYVSAASFQMAEDDTLWNLRLESIRNMFPATRSEQEALRLPVVSWPIPALDMEAFRAAVLNQDMTPYAYTAHHFFRLRDIQALARECNSGSGSSASSGDDTAQGFEEALFPAASSLSGCILDSLWARYYVTHDPACLDRLMQVAGTAVHYIRGELGEKRGVNRFVRALTLKTDPAQAVSDLCGPDRQGRVVVSAGTSACLSLIENSESIPAIWEHINQRRSELRAALETGDASIEQQQLEDACKLLSVVKAAKDISKITSQRVGLDN